MKLIKKLFTVLAASALLAGGFTGCSNLQADHSNAAIFAAYSQKAYGRRVARLAKATGVPWNVAVFAGNIADDAEAIEVLKAVKAAKGTANESLQWELSCGIGRRVAAIEMMLGDTWHKLSCSGQKQTTTLADYLLGE